MLGCDYLLSRPTIFPSKREIMGLVMTCPSESFICHWLLLARADLERVKKQNFRNRMNLPWWV